MIDRTLERVGDRALRRAGVALAVLGLAIAAYLVYVHYAGVKPICNVAHGCEQVQTSKYSKLAGIPVALLGLIGYAGVLTALLVRGETARLAAAAIALVGFGFSAWLTYLELARIHAVCQWCVASAVLMTLLAVVTTARLVRYPT